jgi:hypothetical protein
MLRLRPIALGAGLMAAAVVAADSARAQPAPPPYPEPARPAPAPGSAAAFPPHEIVAIVRSTGLEPLSRPVRQGPTYALRAVDPAGREVRVIVDAHRGRVLRIVPTPRNANLPPSYTRPPAPIAAAPDASRMAALPPDDDEPPEMIMPNASTGPTMLAPSAPRATTHVPRPPPLPRPRPSLADAVAPALPVSPQVAPAVPSPVAPVPAAPPVEEKPATNAVAPPTPAQPAFEDAE